MGNRAIITTTDGDICIYLHWNGGIDSVTAFLRYCELRRFRPFPDSYGIARFVQVVSNYFGGSLSIGIEAGPITKTDADGIDNGIYAVDGWKVVRHFAQEYDEETYDLGDIVNILGSEEHEGYDLVEMLIDIDNCQPEDGALVKNRLGEEYIRNNAYETIEKWDEYVRKD